MFKSAAALSFLLAPLLALAQMPNPFNVPMGGYSNVAAGNSLPLSWQPTTGGTVTLVLRSGDTKNLKAGTVIASNVQNSGSYTWNIPSDITKGFTYTVEIVADGNTSQVNYTPYFPIDSSNTTPSSTSAVTIGAPSGLPSVPASLASAESSATSAASKTASATSSSSMTSSMTSSTASSQTSAASAAATTHANAAAAAPVGGWTLAGALLAGLVL